MSKKILIFADTHLTPRFNQRKFQFLEKIINEADQVIILGDFWENSVSTFDQFINSPWQKLFPLLKKKDSIYIYGNHDRAELINSKQELFSSTHGDRFELKSGDKNFVFEHGHRFLPLHDPPLVRPFLKIIPTMEARGLWHRKKPFTLWYRYNNRGIKRWCLAHLAKDTFLVCAHSHLAEVNFDLRFANPGQIRWGIGSYLTIIDGDVTLHMSSY